jgi:hypothetical protein
MIFKKICGLIFLERRILNGFVLKGKKLLFSAPLKKHIDICGIDNK